MKIGKNKVVEMFYTLKNDQGEVIDSNVGHDPMLYLHGHSQIVPGLEEALEGKEKGSTINSTVSPEKGYGNRNEELVQEVSREMFGGQDVQAGMQFHAESNGHPVLISVVKVEGDQITIDGNHPLAGQNLHFEVEVAGVREANKEEIDHGHVHGPGGHHH